MTLINYLPDELTEHINIPERKIPVIAKTDILVVGSGPAGIAAAVASARTGADTILAERYGCFGGALSVGQVESYNFYMNPRTVVSEGIPKEIENRMIEFGAVQNDYRGTGNFLNPEKYKYLLDCWISECGIRPLLHSMAVGVIKEDNCVKGVIFESKSGCGAVLAKRIVDATGDGDIAAFAGAEYKKGSGEDGSLQPVTMVFGVSGVNIDMFNSYMATHTSVDYPATHGLRAPFVLAAKDGQWPVEREGGAYKTVLPNGDITSFNLTLERGVDGTNVFDLTMAEIHGRWQVMRAIEVLRKYGKEIGFEGCWLRSMAGQIGIRETRRIICEYSITKDDILKQAEFDDCVGVFTTFIDPFGTIVNPKDESHFQIPYRILLPKGLENLLVTGRCVSCEADAFGAVRMMVCCATTGQAAGTAAALSIRENKGLRQLDLGLLQEQLKNDGVRLN